MFIDIEYYDNLVCVVFIFYFKVNLFPCLNTVISDHEEVHGSLILYITLK